MKTLLTKTLKEFNELFSEDCNIYKLKIDCSKLPKEFKRKEFVELSKIRTPCIYWFEAKNIKIAAKIKDELEKYRNEPNRNGRTIPAANSNYESKIIYVGKRNGGYTKETDTSNILGRILYILVAMKMKEHRDYNLFIGQKKLFI